MICPDPERIMSLQVVHIHSCKQNMITIPCLNKIKNHQSLLKGHDEAYMDVSSLPTIKIENLDESNSSIVNIVDEQEMKETKTSNILNLDDKKKHQCEKCSYIAPNRSIYIRHNWNVHDENLSGLDWPVYRCQKCKFETKIEGNFRAHCKSNKCIKNHKAMNI